MTLTDHLTVSVDGHLEPVALPALHALERVWATVSALPIDDVQRRAMRRMFGAGRTDDLERWMRGDETTEVPLLLKDNSSVFVRVAYGDRMTRRQRVGARYVAERVERPVGYPEQWIVRDLLTNTEASGWLPTPTAADEWIRRKVQAADSHGYRTAQGAAQ